MAQETVTLGPTRFFGSITALVTIEERGTDRTTLTEHPVEQGAQITDHAYQQMPELQIRFGATNSSDQADDETYVSQLYDKLQALQQTRQPFSIQTGKRLYQNMLIVSMELITDEKTETALMLVIICRGLIIVQTSVVGVPPADVQADPQKTGPVTNSGAKQPQPTTVQVPQAVTT